MGTGPIPDSVLARLACDSQITRVVFGADSVVLNVGRAERTYTGAKRRAIVARDLQCRFPGCSAPPAMGEVHHIDHWLRDQGQTNVHTGVLICWYHHGLIHDRGIEVRRGPSGAWRFVDRRGRELAGPIG
ncbi:HNH endonuclease signature motif containing protein [Cellulomonas sp. URHD0024]|uniref:HNH endonuclease signature motif containing protein n=1 Tax=Cellulomonas sp. URHD0024 TaxID=1302620 RepID=UPI00048307F2|nr:HNH endonuclease signature motif containing protein [Cellulomonas sp. URHD0024]